MTLQELYEQGKAMLEQQGIPEADLDTRYLLLECFKLSFADFLLKRFRDLEESQSEAAAAFEAFIKKRAKRIPLQYILGSQEFMGLEFYVDENVLIPRQDTETLVEKVLGDHPRKDLTVLDMCTGSGCIAISLFLLGGYQKVTGVDVSEKALRVAEKNAGKLCGSKAEGICFQQSDLFERLNVQEKFDMIVANPPYIPSGVIPDLQPEVRDFEPPAALDGKSDGLYFYREIVRHSRSYLRPGGCLYLEVGHDQAEAVGQMLIRSGYLKVEKVRDIPGIVRVIKGNV